MQDIRQKFTAILEKVEKSVFDAFLLQYINMPVIDEDKLLILISIMDRLDLPYNELENFTLSTMLIQIALDTHEHITNDVESERGRQLTVLAGDYFSGLYYKLLADSEDIMMIKSLSNGIKEVNEHKISVYHHESEGIEKLMASIKIIESALLAKLSEYFKVDFWNEFIENLFFFKRLLHEKRRFVQEEGTVLFEALKKIIYPINETKLNDLTKDQQRQLLKIVDHYLELSKVVIEKGILQLPYLNNFLEKRINNLLNQHQPFAKTFVEEG
ncbi:heptaprenyl diphosphate synthase component 1 [Neobacillus pocheonensis]|uniref:heptaprenyl diphosphate synthase component 1 n=1 Tax=Neobacillus pocheonensis TaxID=363869 RepID=UPI003D28863F